MDSDCQAVWAILHISKAHRRRAFEGPRVSQARIQVFDAHSSAMDPFAGYHLYYPYCLKHCDVALVDNALGPVAHVGSGAVVSGPSTPIGVRVRGSLSGGTSIRLAELLLN
jgi:hypothetical protein